MRHPSRYLNIGKSSCSEESIKIRQVYWVVHTNTIMGKRRVKENPAWTLEIGLELTNSEIDIRKFIQRPNS